MTFLMDPEFWARWLGIVVIDLTLAGDNALVIALAVRTLPKRQQLLGRIWGTVGAVGLRLAFITIVTFLLQIPLLQLVGGLALMWIAVKLIRQGSDGEEHVRAGTTLWGAVWVIIVADVVMSLDNVLAVAAAAHGDLVLVVFGIAFSLPLVVWGSGLLVRLMVRFPWIVWLGGGILAYVAGEMVLKDAFVKRALGPLADTLHYPLPITLGVAITVLGWWFARGQRRRDDAVQEADRVGSGEQGA
jgi:YjbE family integral membrane protein